jgi:hypothetical protein
LAFILSASQRGFLFCSRKQGKIEVFPLLMSLPFVAFYLVVLLAATAGYARSAIVADKLSISKMFETELAQRTMKSASIKTKPSRTSSLARRLWY